MHFKGRVVRWFAKRCTQLTTTGIKTLLAESKLKDERRKLSKEWHAVIDTLSELGRNSAVKTS